MSQQENEKALKAKVADIRRRLMGSPKPEELQTLQLEAQVLEQWARLARVPSTIAEDVDHMDDHDHTMPTGISVISGDPALTRLTKR